MASNNNTFYKTFSGSDAIAFMIFPECKPILLGSLTTLSHSVYREKKPVPLLGKINTGGYTRGMRSIAGTMVFTLISQHLIEDICEQIPYLNEHGKLKADELPFFDIMIIAANEYGAASQMMIYGAEFFEDGQVLSVQDIYIENTFSFVARDIDDFSKINTIVNGSYTVSNSLNADTVTPYSFDEAEYKKNYTETLMTKNKDLIQVQNSLRTAGYNAPVNGILDNETKSALYAFQEDNKLTRSGLVDNTTYQLLTTNTDGEVYTVNNRNGSFVYSDTDKSNIIGIAKYQSKYIGEKVNDFVKIDFYDEDGYIELNNTNKTSDKVYEYIDYQKPGTVINTTLKDFDSNTIGTKIMCNKDSEVKISAISYYPNGSTAVNTRFYKVKAKQYQNMLLAYLPESYIYSISNKSMPYMIEFIVSPDGEEQQKWTVKIKK